MTQGPKDVRKISKNKIRISLPSVPPFVSLFDPDNIDDDYLENLRYFRAQMAAARYDKDPEKYIPVPPLKALAFKGGGAKGGAYPGVVRALEEEGYLDEVDIVIGASAGAITAFMIGLGFSSAQLKALSRKINFVDFTDIKPDGWAAFFNGNKAGNLLDLLHYGAAYTGDAFHDWASYLIEQILGSPNATFEDLHNARMLDPTLKDMVFKATRYNAKPGEVIEQTFSYFDTPHIRIADALRASMAFPGAFAPKTVRYKNGKVFGVFADGGILNNYPVDEANRKEFLPDEYKAVEKKDIHGKAHQLNPAVVGFNLITNVEHLDDEITPFSSRIKRIRRERMHPPKKPKKVNTESDIHAEVEEADASWYFNDIFNAIVWKKIGRPVKEDTQLKQDLYEDQSVQIWVEDVSTLEFDASKSKLQRLYDSGKSAMKLWLRKFKDPTKPYAHPDQFDDRESQANKLLKKSNQEAYYHQKLTDYYIALFHEMNKAKLQKRQSDDKIAQNVKIHYLCRKIDETIASMQKKPELKHDKIERNAYLEAAKRVKERKAAIKNQHQKREFVLQDDKLIAQIAEKLIHQPTEGLRMLKGQLSKVISLVRSQHGGNLLSIAVQAGMPAVTEQVFKIIEDALLQCYYQGRSDEIKYSLAQMLNQFARPPLFKVLAGEHRTKMAKLIMRHGADPLYINPQTNTCGLQDVIENNDFETFKVIIEYLLSRNIDVKNIRVGNQSLGHFVLNSADKSFLSKCYHDKTLSKSFLNYHIKDGNYNDILHEAARIATSEEAIYFKLAKKFSPKQDLHFEKLKQEGQANYDAHQSKRELALKTFEEIMHAQEPKEFIDKVKPQVCLQILTSYIKGTGVLRLSNFAMNPSLAPIFILLCERICTNSKARKQLQQLLAQKYNGKTPLYMAAEAGNAKVVEYLRLPKFDADINNAGPINEPCALLVAAKNGHNDVVSALMASIPYGLRIGYHSVSRRRPDYQEKRTALHYLGMYGTPKAFCDLLYGGGMRSEPSKVAMMKDVHAKTPLSYIIEYNRMDILEEILKRGKGARKGFFINSDYHFARVFGLQVDNKDSLEVLVRAKMINPHMYAYLCKHLSANKVKAANIIQQVEKQVAEIEERNRNTMLLSTQEAAKFEIAKIDTQEYDDWVLIEPEQKQVQGALVERKQHFQAFEAVKTTNKSVRQKGIIFEKEKAERPTFPPKK
ncbi:MAG: patatin-like phospholipase family protein [Proteobacteria bacterium]|nr:patatin-like phospholipase family protein [Pseudomonadota bacterium]